jgi:hypothetical protein
MTTLQPTTVAKIAGDFGIALGVKLASCLESKRKILVDSFVVNNEGGPAILDSPIP